MMRRIYILLVGIMIPMIASAQNDWAKYERYAKANEMLQEYARANKIKYVDYHSAMADERGGLSSELAKDGVHPTREGYDIMKALLLKALK